LNQPANVLAPDVFFSATNLGFSRRGSSKRSEGRLDAVLGGFCLENIIEIKIETLSLF
jgi:hypothetical protein